jgi:hypothetical protein
MHATRTRPLRLSRTIALLLLSVGALVFTFTPLASAQPVVDVGGSATGTGTYGPPAPATQTLTLAVTGGPLGATGPVTWTSTGGGGRRFTGLAHCIAISETATGFRASIAGEITSSENLIAPAARGFDVTVYDNTPPPMEIDRVSPMGFDLQIRTTCAFERSGTFELTAGDFTVTPVGVCPPNDDDDGDGLTNNNESLFSTLLNNSDSDNDGINDGNDDANGNGEDDEDEDDDEDDGCPDEDSDDDGEDDEDEDDDEDDD